MKSEYFFRGVFGVMIFIRICATSLYFYYPFWGWVITCALDAFDYWPSILGRFNGLTYQELDKTADLITRVVLLISVFALNWEFKYLFLAFFLLRFVADIIFFLRKNRKIFFYLPNIVDFMYPLYALFILVLNKEPDIEYFSLMLVVATVAKVFHEYTLHSKLYMEPVSRYLIKRMQNANK